MFKLYDLDMNEIPFPDGVMPLDIFVGSIAKERQAEAIPGRNGVVDYGTNYTERSVDLSLWIISSDTVDYRLLRNELYALFDARNEFYVAESNVPSRVLKIAVDDSYIPERITRRHASVEITCRTLDSVFWESTYTTLELHDSGYSATAEKYGLVDNIDDEKVKYRFEESTDVISFDNPTAWEAGSINSSTGALVDDTNNIRTKNYINVTPGKEYTLKETLAAPNLRQWWVMEYDSSDNFIGWNSTPFSGPLEMTFIARGSKLKLRTAMISENTITPSDVGVITIPELTSKASVNTFTVYNAGNVTVEPEYMDLSILVLRASFSESFTIRNVTTSEEFTYYGNVSSQSILLDGINVLRSSAWNSFRNTNRRFIRLAPGDNEFEVTGGTFDEIRYDFKFLYK